MCRLLSEPVLVDRKWTMHRKFVFYTSAALWNKMGCDVREAHAIRDVGAAEAALDERQAAAAH
jgi:hypothetical protein